MNIERSITFSIALALSTAGGCNEAKPYPSDALERATSPTPSLTATAPLVRPKPAKEPNSAPEAEPAARALPLAHPVAEPAPDAKPVMEPVLDGQDGLLIRRLITAPEVGHREPVAASSVFKRADERVYAFVEVSNESNEGKALMVHFIGPDGQVSGGVELNIPPSVPRWRTWAHTKHAKAPGLWHVEIRSMEGALLGALPFEVESIR